jgi:hypothetical protein
VLLLLLLVQGPLPPPLCCLLRCRGVRFAVLGVVPDLLGWLLLPLQECWLSLLLPLCVRLSVPCLRPLPAPRVPAASAMAS